MKGEIFLEHYRLNPADDGSRLEIGRNGPAITYRGSDLQSGAPVALTLLPTASVDPGEREQFEERARAAMMLDHVNIAKTVAFGTAGDQFIFVSEYPQGETVEEWILAHGPMPADAVLRVALQVVAALSAGSFQNLNHPAIQPSNLIIVPGKTAEGGWPLVKLMHFALAGLKVAPGQPVQDWVISDFAGPEQLLRGTVDFRSEIYSLGATMCFLLTGVFYSAQPRSPQTKRFARPFRKLIVKTLADDPDDRPQDPVMFAQELRTCLAKVERRQALLQKLGLPFRPVVAKRPRRLIINESLARPVPLPPRASIESETTRARAWFPRRALVAVAILLGLGIVAAALLPEDVVTTALHRRKSAKTIGVPVGVADASPATLTTSRPGAASVSQTNVGPIQTRSPNRAAVTGSPAMAGTSQPVSPNPQPSIAGSAVAPAESTPIIAQSSLPQSHQSVEQPSPSSRHIEDTVAMVQQSPAANNPTTASAASAAPRNDVSPTEIATNNAARQPAPPAEGPENTSPAPNRSVAEAGSSSSNQESDRSSGVEDEKANENQTAPSPAPVKKRSKPATAGTRTTKKSYPSSKRQSRDEFESRESQSDATRSGNVRARVVGVTPGGNLILRLPSGKILFVRPHNDVNNESPDVPPRRRIIMERRPVMIPPPPLQPFRLDPDGD